MQTVRLCRSHIHLDYVPIINELKKESLLKEA